jgi:hypothetical protein
MQIIRLIDEVKKFVVLSHNFLAVVKISSLKLPKLTAT